MNNICKSHIRLNIQRQTSDINMPLILSQEQKYMRMLCRSDEYINQYGIEMFFSRRMQERDYGSLARRIDKNGYTIEFIASMLGFEKEWKLAEIEHKAQAAAKTAINGGKILWSTEKFWEEATNIFNAYRCIPAMDYLSANGHCAFVGQLNRFSSMQELQDRFQCSDKRLYSLSGTKWLSFAETCLANWFEARGIVVAKGEAYPEEYAEFAGRKYGLYDMHVVGSSTKWSNVRLDIEIFGGGPISGEARANYERRKEKKIAFHAGDPSFIAVDYSDTYSENKLTNIFKAYFESIKVVKTLDGFQNIPTTMMSVAEEMRERCRELCDKLPDKKLPPLQWFTKTESYKNRIVYSWEPETWVGFQWALGRIGYKNMRVALSQQEFNRNQWTKESVLAEVKDLYETYDFSPSTLLNRYKQTKANNPSHAEIWNRANRVMKAADKLYSGKLREVYELLDIPMRAKSEKRASSVQSG